MHFLLILLFNITTGNYNIIAEKMNAPGTLTFDAWILCLELKNAKGKTINQM